MKTNFSLPFFFLRSVVCFGLAIVCLSGISLAAVPTPSLEVTFDEADSDQVRFVDERGQKVDPFSLEGEGVGGDTSSSRAFDNSTATGMGGTNKNPGLGGRVEIPAGSEIFAGARSFTIQGWYYAADGVVPGNYARLLAASRVAILFDKQNERGLNLAINGKSVLCPDGAYRMAGEWVFFAVTFSGADEKNNVRFYVGSRTEPVRLVGRAALPVTEVSRQGAEKALILGNMSSRERPFAGLLDNFRIWADDSDIDSALDQETLEQVRRTDI